MQNKIKIFLLILFLFATKISVADIAKPFVDYKNNNYQEAFPELLKLAIQGDIEAQGLVGRMYFFGLGVSKNIPESFNWSLKSAESNNPLAQNVMGVFYQSGIGVNKDINTAISWFLKSAKQNFSLAQSNLGNIYSYGTEVEPNYPEAAHWYRAASNNNNAHAKYRLGLLYLYGIGIPTDTDKGIKEIEGAVNLGNVFATNELADLYKKGRYVNKNDSIAIELFRKSAALNDPVGQIKLAQMMLLEKNYDLKEEEIITLIKKSAYQGNYMANLFMVDPPANLKISFQDTESLFGNTDSIKRLANEYRNKDSTLIEIGDLFLNSKISKEINNLKPLNVITINNAIHKIKNENSVEVKKVFKDAHIVLREIAELKKINSNNSNARDLINFLTIQEYSVYEKFEFKDINNQIFKKINTSSHLKRLGELKKFSEYLINSYAKEHFFHNVGIDLLFSYYKNANVPGWNDKLNNLLRIKKSDEYISSYISLYPENHLSFDDEICQVLLANSINTTLYSKLYSDRNDKKIQQENLKYLISQAGRARDCIYKPNDSDGYLYIKSFYRRIHSFALSLDITDLDVEVNKRLVELLDESNLEEKISATYNYAQSLRRNGDFVNAENNLNKLINYVLRYQKQASSDKVISQVSEWAKNPNFLLTYLYRDDGRIELANDSIKRQIRIDLSGLNSYSTNIVNTSLARTYLFYAQILKKRGDSFHSIFLLKKAFQNFVEYDLDYRNRFKNERASPNKYSALDESLVPQLISELLNNNRTLEAEYFLKFLKKNEMALYLRDSNIFENFSDINTIYTRDELLFEALYKDHFEKIRKIYQKGYYPNYINDSNLNLQHEKVIDNFIDFLTSSSSIVESSESTINRFIKLSPLNNALTVQKISNKTAVVKYFLTKDKLFILIKSASNQELITVDIGLSDLTRKVYEFRFALRDPKNFVEKNSTDLYLKIFFPLEKFLIENNVSNIILSLDGSLRYVPFRALFDGKKFLLEKYNFTVVEDFDIYNKNSVNYKEWRVAGFGTSKQYKNFPALFSVEEELKGIIKNNHGGLFPGNIYLNDSFTFNIFNNSLKANYSVIHIATHFQFSPGAEINSFLLLGNGDRLSLSQMKSMSFKNVDLLTFSACQTALGGGKDETGIEISGLSYIALKNGAGSVISSLWSVNDKSTALLMKKMYENRFINKSSKTESLRMAQLYLLQSKDFSHPFYWAPFEIHGFGAN